MMVTPPPEDHSVGTAPLDVSFLSDDFREDGDSEELGLVKTADRTKGHRHSRGGLLQWAWLRTTTSTATFVLCLLLAANAILLLGGIFFRSNTTSGVTRTAAHGKGWVRPEKVYGLVHIPKTAGTEINGDLAIRYERVCGNKGYSYDALLHNQRMKEYAEQHDDFAGKENTQTDLSDAVSKLYKHHNRGRLPKDWMREVGFDDCDYIALEDDFHVWLEFAKQWPMELHVPCRDSLENLMSQFNYRHKYLDCNATNIEDYILSSNLLLNQIKSRFRPHLLPHPNVTVKCFDPMPPNKYTDFMGTILQGKRIVTDYFHVSSNDKRNRENECIWYQTEDFRENVRQILRDNVPYYDWCERCIGSENELILDQY